MKFFHRPVQDFEGITHNFEQLEGIFNSPPNQAISFLQLLTAGNVHVAYGSATVTWAGASQTSSTATVTHGLGTAPAAILVVADWTNVKVAAGSTNPTSTTLDVTAKTVDGSVPVNGTTATLYWLAIG